MKKTQLKDSTRNIWKRIVSYLSICLVIMLGIGATLTTRFMEYSINNEAATYLADHAYKNYDMVSSLGISDANIEAIKSVDGVTDAEGFMYFSVSVQKGDSKRSATLLSRTNRISVPELVDGTMPTAKDECAVGEDFADDAKYEIGDEITMHLKGSVSDDVLNVHKFKIVGTFRHPDYIHRKHTNTVIVADSAFNEEETGGYYIRAYVKSEDEAPERYFSDQYLEKSDVLLASLEELAAKLEIDRAQELKDEANAKIDDEWKKAEAELEDAEQQIEDGEAELNAKLADGRAQLNSAQNKLDKTVKDYEKKIKDGEKKLKKIKDALAKINKKLPGVKKDLADRRKAYEADIKESEEQLAEREKQLAELEKMGEFASDELVQELAQSLLDNMDSLWRIYGYITEIQDICSSDDVKDLVDQIKDITEGKIDLTKIVKAIAEYDTEPISTLLDELNNLAQEIRDNPENIAACKDFIQSYKDYIALVKDNLNKVKEYEGYIKKYEENKPEIDSRIKKEEKNVKKYKLQLKAEKKKYQAQIDEGWNKYYSEKAKYEGKLAEAVLLLEENREKAEEKLAEARAEVEDITCKWIVLDRRANSGFLDMKSQIDSLASIGNLFGVMFILITAMVCFSTLAIIIEEQKKLIGTVKAFGFHKMEVLSKYLLFGVSAAVIGSILAAVVGAVLSRIVLNVYAAQDMYQFGDIASAIKTLPPVVLAIAMIVVCAIASVVACLDILKSPASMLMKGETLGTKGKVRKTAGSSGKGTLYSRLIFRNMSDDKVRIIISTVIVAACTLLIGAGFTVKFAFDNMLEKQSNVVNNYDIRVDFPESTSDKDRAAIDNILSNQGTDYTEALFAQRMFRSDTGISGLYVLAGDPAQIKDFVGITLEGKPVEIPSDGVVVSARMSERNGLSIGRKFTIYDSNVEPHEAKVTGLFTLYTSRYAVTTAEGYKKIFGEDYKSNCRFVKLNGANEAELKTSLTAVNESISFESSTGFRSAIEATGILFNVATLVTTGIAIIMSFMILTNLANIFVTRKKNELIVMRVNGFSIKQTKAYLAREAVITTIVGLVAGVLLGSLMTSLIIKVIEPADIQFDRAYHIVVWAIAVGLEGLFALIIYSSAFNRIKHFQLRDIA